MNFKYLISSGCSFSDNCFGGRWPHFFANSVNAELYNRGQGSCGNDWISKTAIYEAIGLISAGYDPNQFIIIVMWSGIDRKGIFVSKKETHDYDNLINNDHPNPVRFYGEPPNEYCKSNIEDGYLVGSMGCNFQNKNITQMKQELIGKFYNDEALAIESYEHFLRLQWFCKSYGIKLINLTYMDIMHYPNRELNMLTKDYYHNIKHLYDMIDFDNWIFWKDTMGLFEYARDNNLSFYEDKVHPRPEAHKYYVENFLIPELSRRNIL